MIFERSTYIDRLIRYKHNHQIKVITGIRRSGKSFLLFELFAKHLKESGVRPDHIIQIDLENRRNSSLRNPDALLSFIDSKMTDEQMYYILLDEIQLVAEFEDVLNSYLKVHNADVYVTGSNSRFLSTDVITKFRGRSSEVHLFPLSLAEIMQVCTHWTWEQAWQQYMTYGGLPMVVQMEEESEKAACLNDIFKNVYLKDIIERYSVRNDYAMELLLNIISSSIGSLTNPQKLENTFTSSGRIKLSAQTIKQYLDYFEDAYIIRRSNRYDVKGKKYISTPFKCYYSDLGLRNARLNFRQIEETHLMENAIFNELCMRGFNVDVGVVETRETDTGGHFLRKQLEVDFVVNQGSRRYYIQSAYALPTESKTEQEVRPLRCIQDSFKKIIVVKDDILLRRNEEGIVTMGLRQFLCEPESLDL